MTEPRPPIHPAPGDWPEDKCSAFDARFKKTIIPTSIQLEEKDAEIARLRAELAAANERAEKAEQTLLKQPDWERHWQHQVARREEVQAILEGVRLERDHFRTQWQTALRDLARKDAALWEAEQSIVEEIGDTNIWPERDTVIETIRAALEPRKEGGE